MKIYIEEEVKEVADTDEQLQQYHRLTAAGGLVKNSEGQLLMIFRRGKWDLPKGKVEDGEPIELCAQRETKEETGLTELTLQRFLVITYHSYVEKKQLMLKETHWFLYSTPGTPALKPQVEEDIHKAEWVNPANLSTYTSNTYHLIRDVLREAGYEEQ